MRSLRLLLTFDYELPLGAASCYEQGLFAPAARLLDRGRTIGVPLVLFADMCSALRFRKWDFAGYYQPFREQLEYALSRGNDVQLNIHPHWMTSAYRDGAFEPSTDFALGRFLDRPILSPENILQLAYDELMDTCRAIDPAYQVVAFRPGGYDLGPDPDRIYRKLQDLGIHFSSSVIPGWFKDVGFSRVDYRQVPEREAWILSPGNSHGRSPIFELPITGAPTSIPSVLKRRLRKIRHQSVYAARRYDNAGRGMTADLARTSTADKLRELLNPRVLTFDQEYADVSYLMDIVRHRIQRSPIDADLILTLISHPRSMGAFHLDTMARFVDTLRREYAGRVDFTTYRALAENLLPAESQGPVPSDGDYMIDRLDTTRF